ncbi:Serum paraoxonase/arylesterase 1, partial [Mortierella sp. GBA39]
MCMEDLRLDGWLKDVLVVYDIENEVARSMELVGFPTDVDRVFHGMDFYEDPTTLTSETKNLALTLFVINHRRTGSVVEVFEYTRKQDVKDDGNGSLGVVRYIETIANDLIRTPNDIVAMGKLSFYITNDHYYREGFMRHIEGFGRRPWGDVVFVSPQATFIAYNGIASSNGITTNPNRTLVYVSAFHGGTLDIFHPGYADTSSPEMKKTVEDKYRLIFVESVKLGFVNDNVFYDTLTNSLLVAGHSKVLELAAGFNEPEGAPMQSASKVVQVTKNCAQQHPFQRSSASWFSLSRVGDWPTDRYLVKTVLEDSGKGVGGISTATTAA